MEQKQFYVSWEAYNKNLCNGLNSLQQNSEFVDMTLAADGHFVKVHQVILALASPYIKALIASTNSQHPVIFLNNVSHNTLCSILKYIYTGEVLVSNEHMSDFIQAGKSLHIKGLDHVNVPLNSNEMSQSDDSKDTEEQSLMDNLNDAEPKGKCLNTNLNITIQSDTKEIIDPLEHTLKAALQDDILEETKMRIKNPKRDSSTKQSSLQYTVSNQGSLQMILNRFVYYLKHSNRDNTRQWRCVDYYSNLKCPAHIFTKDDMVIQRLAAHTHTFHDDKILKKIRKNKIFTAVADAEEEGKRKKYDGESQEGVE